MTKNALTINDLRAQLAAKFQEQRNFMPASASTKIKPVPGKGFTLPDGKIIPSIEAVILDIRYLHRLYPPYKPGNIESPFCWAVGKDAKNMAPDEKSSKPAHDKCEGCPHDEWGSGNNGIGKRCKNDIRLALLQPDADEDAPIFTLELPPASNTSFTNTLKKLEVPTQTVVMKFTMDERFTYVKVITELLSPAPDALAPFIMDAMAKAQPLLDRGFDYEA